MTESDWIKRERARFEAVFPVPAGLKYWHDLNNYRGLRGGRHTLQIRYNECWFGWLAAKRDAVPEGWRVVPEKPTDDMVKATNLSWALEMEDVRFAYTVMINAAPIMESENG